MLRELPVMLQVEETRIEQFKIGIFSRMISHFYCLGLARNTRFSKETNADSTTESAFVDIVAVCGPCA